MLKTKNEGAKTCFFFSISGVIFLSSIAIGVQQNLIDIEIGNNERHKGEIIEGIVGAILMYVACLGISAFYWYKSILFTSEYDRIID